MVDVVEELTTRPVRALSDGDDAVSASKPCSPRSKNRLSPLAWNPSRFDACVQLFLGGGPQPELRLRGYSGTYPNVCEVNIEDYIGRRSVTTCR